MQYRRLVAEQARFEDAVAVARAADG